MAVRPGQPLRIRARDWNDCLAAAAAYKGSQSDLFQPGGAAGLAPGIVTLKNNTANDRARFEILGLGDPIFTPTDRLAVWQNQVGLKGETVAFSSHFGGKFAVLLESIKAGEIGRAMVHGVCPVKIDVAATAHGFCDVENAASDTLKSYTAGSARILWKESGTGDKWAYVILGACHVSLWRYTLNADFAGSPLSASADLLSLDGTDTAQDVTVYDYLNVFGGVLSNGDAGYCCLVGGVYHAIQAPCPPS